MLKVNNRDNHNGVVVTRTSLYFFKGHLRYKKITSENVASEENLFVS